MTSSRVAVRASVPLAVLIVVLLAACGSGESRGRGRAGVADSALLRAVGVARFAGPVYGASGAVQLEGDRVLIVEDEKRHPLDIVDRWGTGAVTEVAPREVGVAIADAGLEALNDLESLTADPRGRLYASTSHSLTLDGQRRPEREALVRFVLSADGTIRDARVCRLLRDALVALDDTLAAAANRPPKKELGLNIEALAYDPVHNRLLLGFRSPLANERALAVWITNPDDVFDHGAAPALSGPVRLDLGGEGIRDLAYDPSLHGFLVLAGAANKSKHGEPALYLWRGDSTAITRLTVPELAGLNAEGVAVLTAGTARALLVVSDDGEFDAAFFKGRSMTNHGTPARYLLLPYERLLAANPSIR